MRKAKRVTVMLLAVINRLSQPRACFHQRRDCVKAPGIHPWTVGGIATPPEECPLDSTGAVEGPLLRRSYLLTEGHRASVQQRSLLRSDGITGYCGAIERSLLRSGWRPSREGS
jgi:hypothetical protein